MDFHPVLRPEPPVVTPVDVAAAALMALWILAALI